MSNLQSAYGCGPLIFAVIARDDRKVKNLLSQCPSIIEELDAYGSSPFHHAVNSSPSCLKLLLSMSDRSTLNQVDQFGLSAIHYAVYNSSSRCRLPSPQHKRCRGCHCAELQPSCSRPVAPYTPNLTSYHGFFQMQVYGAK